MTDLHGRPDFEALMERLQSRKSEHRIQSCVFDVVYYEGQKVTIPLIERKELLDVLPEDTESVVKVKWLYGNGEVYFDLVKQQGLEGIVMKKASFKNQVNKRSKD